MIKSIHELYPRQFAERLATVVSHSHPVETASHLKGREANLKVVEQAIYAPGRHVFIHGERGVGKTSLAKTAGLDASSSESCFKQIGCSSDSSFNDLLRLVIEVFRADRLATVEKQSNWSFASIFGFKVGSKEVFQAPPTISVSIAADILASLDNDGTNSLRVVVVDEVEKLSGPEIRGQFAGLIKLLGDRAARLTFIFTGVGADLRAILGEHESAFRQLAQVPLHRLEFQATLDIIDDALELFGLSWEAEPTRTARFRIAAIANGFPYYVHLLVEKLLYAVYDDKDATGVTLAHLQTAIAAAVHDAEEVIKRPYEDATRGRNADYKLAVWACADSWELERTSAHCYGSYVGICEALEHSPTDNKRFLQILAALKRQGYGPILKAGFRKGLYEFSENIVRGYVRLCAAAEDIDLNDKRPDEGLSNNRVHVPNKRHVDPRRVGGAPRKYR